MTLTQVLLAEAEAVYSIAERLFRRVADDELTWTPATGRDWMTVGQLLMHCASFGCGKAVQGFVEGDWGAEPEDPAERDHIPTAAALPSVASVRQALQLLAEDRRLAISGIVAAGEENLLGRQVAAPWGGPEGPLFQQLLRMIAHLVQHKGQLFYYLKLMGRDVTTRDLWEA
jgi:DinB superfamily